MNAKIIAILFIYIFLAGCAALMGTVSTENCSNEIKNRKFIIIGADTLSLRDKKIRNLISDKLIEHGYIPVSNKKEANTGVFLSSQLGKAPLMLVVALTM